MIRIVMHLSLLLLPAVSVFAEVQAPGTNDFVLSDSTGKDVRLSDYRGKIVVLEWTNPDCPFVKRHYREGNIKKLVDEFKGKGVVWLTINSTKYSEPEQIKEWIEANKIDWPVLSDKSGKVGHQFGAKTTPHIFIVDAAGKLAYQGAIDSDPQGDGEQRQQYVREALGELLAGKAPAIAETQPYGCSVKYAS